MESEEGLCPYIATVVATCRQRHRCRCRVQQKYFIVHVAKKQQNNCLMQFIIVNLKKGREAKPIVAYTKV